MSKNSNEFLLLSNVPLSRYNRQCLSMFDQFLQMDLCRKQYKDLAIKYMTLRLNIFLMFTENTKKHDFWINDFIEYDNFFMYTFNRNFLTDSIISK